MLPLVVPFTIIAPLVAVLKALSTASAYHIHAVGGKKCQLVRTQSIHVASECITVQRQRFQVNEKKQL
jgi:hypothetical protein